MTNAFTAKLKTDTEWLKKANASARSSQTMPNIVTGKQIGRAHV